MNHIMNDGCNTELINAMNCHQPNLCKTRKLVKVNPAPYQKNCVKANSGQCSVISFISDDACQVLPIERLGEYTSDEEMRTESNQKVTLNPQT